MILFEENFEKEILKNKVKLKCDYCGKCFERKKSQIIRGRKIIQKDSCLDKKCISSKRYESNIKKYGVANPSQNKEIRKKQEETLFKNYGVIVPCKNKKIKEKLIKTNISLYGNKCSLHSEKNKIKTKKTWQNKYGVDHPFASAEIRKKIKETMNKKYGEYYTKTEDYRKKTKKTCLKKYGFDHSSKSNCVKEKRKKTNLKKFGFEFASQNQDIKNKIFSKGNQRKNYGKTQNEIKEYIEIISGLKFNSKMIDGKEIDIYNENLKLGIEYCGLWWHNELSPEPRTKEYHWNKYNICLSNNIKLITIFEDEWKLKKEKCKSYINSTLGKFEFRIFARKCKIIEVENKISNDFYSKYHLFEKPYGTKKSFGLIYNNEILGIMSLGNHHRKSSDVVINRLCFKPGYQIVGGVSKLFNACKKWCKNKNYTKITTWSDNRWSNGNVYKKLGFILSADLRPDYSYVDLKGKYKRYSKQSRKKSNSNCPKDITEIEWSKKNNLARIWDCGKKRWVYNIK